MSKSAFLVAQLGARMHYAVPRILYSAGKLSRLFTDITANRGPLRCLNLLPRMVRPAAVTRLLNRVPKGIPRGLIRTNSMLGISYARRFAKTRTERERIELFLRVGTSFCQWVTRQNWADATVVYVYNTAGLEVLKEAQRRGLATVSEQTIAPFRVERKILAEERERYPSWGDDDGERPEFAEYADREEKEWQLADSILCGSEFVRESIKQAGGPIEKCRILPYGVDLDFAALPSREHDGPLRVLTVGAVGLRKGTPYAIEAAKRLRGQAVFRWVGAFKAAESARTDLGPDVEFVGMVPRSEVINHYAWADVFLLPSLCEGSATATYEALTAGRPVVCTPNCGSVVRDGVEGYVIPVRDINALVDRLERLARDSDLRMQMADAARHKAAAVNFESYARDLLATLQQKSEP
jgi:glycosyltransferase involved in cell wall biosynthesis